MTQLSKVRIQAKNCLFSSIRMGNCMLIIVSTCKKHSMNLTTIINQGMTSDISYRKTPLFSQLIRYHIYYMMITRLFLILKDRYDILLKMIIYHPLPTYIESKGFFNCF